MSSRRRSDSGTVSIEVVALVPILLLVALAVFQVGVTAWTAAQTQEAARQAARAQSLGRDPEAAAQGALPDGLRVERIVTDEDTVELEVDVPGVSFLPHYTVTRSATIKAAP